MKDLNKIMKDTKAAQLIVSMNEIETRSPIKVGDMVTVRKQSPRLQTSSDVTHEYRWVPGVVVDVIEVYGDCERIELRVAPKLKSERIGNPLIRWWYRDKSLSQVLLQGG